MEKDKEEKPAFKSIKNFLNQVGNQKGKST